jgi:hypothetical protein
VHGVDQFWEEFWLVAVWVMTVNVVADNSASDAVIGQGEFNLAWISQKSCGQGLDELWSIWLQDGWADSWECE